MKLHEIEILKGKIVRLRPVSREIVQSRHMIVDDIWMVKKITDMEILLYNFRNGLETNIHLDFLEGYKENGTTRNLTQTHFILNLKVQVTILNNKTIDLRPPLAGTRKEQPGPPDHPMRRMNRR
ncbi:MAG: hypothetical protein HY200_02095 [Nitrospirae bacterium]|nr:hypothetical protein [Nitrospirota bacterium]MBI3593728.1 hypothetical protein [Nitrospirota bacterium]